MEEKRYLKWYNKLGYGSGGIAGKGGAGTCYMTDIFHDASLPGSFPLAFCLPILLGMSATPILIKRFQRIRLPSAGLSGPAEASFSILHFFFIN